MSTTTVTLQRSQLMFPLYPPLSVLEKRIPDLLILLFLLSWSLETGMTLMCALSFGAVWVLSSPGTDVNQVFTNIGNDCAWYYLLLLCFTFFSLTVPSCVFSFWKAASLLSKHVRNLVVLISPVACQCVAQRPALCSVTRPLIEMDARFD